jgi:hypothetical protein
MCIVSVLILIHGISISLVGETIHFVLDSVALPMQENTCVFIFSLIHPNKLCIEDIFGGIIYPSEKIYNLCLTFQRQNM